MKTTIEINDDLANQAKSFARCEGTTLRAIIEQGIRMKLENSDRKLDYSLPDKSVKGRGLQPGFQDKTWEGIREAAYEYSGK